MAKATLTGTSISGTASFSFTVNPLSTAPYVVNVNASNQTQTYISAGSGNSTVVALPASTYGNGTSSNTTYSYLSLTSAYFNDISYDSSGHVIISSPLPYWGDSENLYVAAGASNVTLATVLANMASGNAAGGLYWPWTNSALAIPLLQAGVRPDGDVFAAYYVATHYQYNGGVNITFSASGGITPSDGSNSGLSIGDGVTTPSTYYLPSSGNTTITAIGGYVVVQ
jgi:hypothetical protein